MDNLSETAEKRTRGPKPGCVRETPYYPDRVLKIIKLRKGGLTLQEVAEMFGMTPAGVSHIVARWGNWAAEQKK